jgi:hypothetical protein
LSDLQARVVDLLRGDLAAEAASGFPLLYRIPYTDIIWFLDYYATIPTAEQEDLLDGLARWGAISLFPMQYSAQDIQQLEKNHPVFARFRGMRNQPGYKGGYRYTDVKFLSMVPKVPEFGDMEGWLKNFSGLALQPRQDLLPGLDCLKPIKAAALRKLLSKGAFAQVCPEKKNVGGGNWHYVGFREGSQITVRMDFNSRLGQLVYGVSVMNAEHPIKLFRLSYERLWDANLGWDYLTEENAARSIDLLAELVVYLTNLANRVNNLGN